VRHTVQTATLHARTGGTATRTFVVRIPVPAEPPGDGPGALRGVVDHVQSGRTAPFADEAALLALLRAWGAST